MGREDSLPVPMLWTSVDVEDGVALGHLRVGADLAEVGFLNKDKVSRGMHGGSYR